MALIKRHKVQTREEKQQSPGRQRKPEVIQFVFVILSFSNTKKQLLAGKSIEIRNATGIVNGRTMNQIIEQQSFSDRIFTIFDNGKLLCKM